MDMLHYACRYLHHKLLADGPHAIHSPFVFDLYNKVIRDETPYYYYEFIESLRSAALLDRSIIDVQDYGTGGIRGTGRRLKVSHIAKNFVQAARVAQLLSRLVNHFSPQRILEMGTSLGISTLYLAYPSGQSTVITLEGCGNTSMLAKKNFQSAGIKNIEVITGEFDISLKKALDRPDPFDFIYFDGNHSKAATMRYFEACLQKKNEFSVFVFDDIHWSREMSSAWLLIRSHEEVSISIDLFHIGILFFRKGISKQSFDLKF
jgi:predicted O-methyltransferase YrrM